MPIAPRYSITNRDELLHRNAHPTFIDNGRISSQVFRLKDSDQRQLSLQQNMKASAEVAYRRYTAQGFASGGVWSVSIAECQQIGLAAYDDPIDGDDSHAVIDLTEYNNSQTRKFADKLAAKARLRGCQYAPAQ